MAAKCQSEWFESCSGLLQIKTSVRVNKLKEWQSSLGGKRAAAAAERWKVERTAWTIYQIKTRIGCQISFPERRFAASTHTATLHTCSSSSQFNLKIIISHFVLLYNAKSTHDPNSCSVSQLTQSTKQTNIHSHCITELQRLPYYTCLGFRCGQI